MSADIRRPLDEQPAPTTARAEDRRWGRAEGVESLGQVQGSGLREPAYLIRRGDGQVLQVSELIHLVLMQLTGDRPAREVADAVSEAFGRRLTVEGFAHLVRTKLQPLGLVRDLRAAAPTAPVPRVNPLLQLHLRVTLLPARVVQRVAALLAPLFWPPVVVAAVVGLVVLDVVLLTSGASLAEGLEQLLATPALLLGTYALLAACALFHETGHAAGCRYGGATPGRIGFGLYLVFPAFFTEVTDSYRLGRAGRLRTDLGGLYFNAWCLLAAGVAYLLTGEDVLVLLVLIMHISMAHQLIPTLRFDGYFVLADIAGVPDLFSRIRPVLRSVLRRGPVDPRVAELRPATRRIVTLWVLVVVPTLLGWLLWVLWHSPVIVGTTADAVAAHLTSAAQAVADRSPLSFLAAVLAMVLISLPVLGLALVSRRLLLLALLGARRGLAGTRRAWRRRAVERVPHHAEPRRRKHMTTSSRVPSRGRHENTVTPGAPAPSSPDQAAAEDRPGGTAAPDDDGSGTLWRTLAQVGEAGAAAGGPTEAAQLDHPVGPSGVDRLTAAAFTDEAVFTPARPRPTEGWQRQVHDLTGGRVSPPPGARERRHLDTLARIRTPIEGTRRVVVMSRKGGVGKTTLTLALGSTFAIERGDRVVAVDANPDAGNLAHRLAHGGTRPNARSITDVLADLERIRTYADLQAYTSQAPESRLEVLASDDDPRISLALTRASYHRVITLLDAFYNLIVLDTGTGILDSANQGLIEDADQLVLVLKPGLDGARAAALTLDWLDEHGHADLVERAVVVINGVRRGVGVPLDKIEAHFTKRCAHVCTVPWDEALEQGAQTDVRGLHKATQEALRQVAAAVADNFVRVRGNR
ncbi:AAA family ATPase [Georgenia sp. AZ-5]|uniref:MinD/ParA family ATP-binding protein n=1 Tax=Georgenia sp. AZ-5 TaxID=3367526 RepID=UPI003754FB7B